MPTPDDDIGYGRPPKSTQWRKGHSGNPAGRPKGALGMRTVMQDWAKGRMTVRRDGKRRRISNLQALVEILWQDVLATRNLRAAAQLLRLAQTYVAEDIAAVAGRAGLSPDELAILGNHAAFLALLEEAKKS